MLSRTHWLAWYNESMYQIWGDSDENFIGNMILSETLTLSPGHIFLSKYSDKNTKKLNISDCKHPHNDEYDTMKLCTKFELILKRTWLKLWFNHEH